MLLALVIVVIGKMWRKQQQYNSKTTETGTNLSLLNNYLAFAFTVSVPGCMCACVSLCVCLCVYLRVCVCICVYMCVYVVKRQLGLKYTIRERYNKIL